MHYQLRLMPINQIWVKAGSFNVRFPLTSGAVPAIELQKYCAQWD